MFNKDKETKEEKLERKEQEQLEKLVKKYNLQKATRDDLDNLSKISTSLLGTNLGSAGVKLSLGVKPEERLKVEYLSAIVEQNFLIIKLLMELRDK